MRPSNQLDIQLKRSVTATAVVHAAWLRIMTPEHDTFPQIDVKQEGLGALACVS